MIINKLRLATSIAVTAILSVGLVNMKAVKVFASTTNIPSTLLEQVKNTQATSTADENDPLLDGKYVSNGYSDNGYTFLKPSDTSSERTSSFHLDTQEGWSNDLQTIVFDSENKEWNIYYLHTEKVVNGDTGAKQNWERVTTRDFIHFSKPNIAIADLKGDIGDAWSSAWTGSIITNQGNIAGVPKGAKVAYFSGLSNKDNQQNIWAAWSDDNGKTFSHPLNDKKIILDHYWPWTSINRSDERDPSVFYWKGKLIMYAAEGDKIGVYKSEDGLVWSNANTNQADSKLSSDLFFKGLPFEAPVECPAVRSMKMTNGSTKQVLFFGAKAPQAGQTTGTYYIVGHLNDQGLFVPETNAKRMDQGTDYYGANFTGSDDLTQADDSLITMGWVGNWNYTNSGIKANQSGFSPNSTRLGTYTLARKITLNNDLTISSSPVTENLEKDPDKKVTGTVGNQPASKNNYYELLNLTQQPVNSKFNLHFSTKNSENYQGAVKISFTQGKDSNFIIFDPATGKYRIAGQSSELSGGAADYYKNGLASGLGYINDSGLKGINDFSITAFTDKNVIELFFSNGQTATLARFCVNNVQDVKVEAQDENKVNQFDIAYGQVGTKLVGFEQQSGNTDNTGGSSTGNNTQNTGSTSNDDTTSNVDSGKVENEPGKPKQPADHTNGKKAKKRTVMHDAFIYTTEEKRTSYKLKAGSIVRTYGIKKINGKRYYVLTNKRCILAANISGTKRKLKHNAFVYDNKAKRIKKLLLQKKSAVRTYGAAIKLNGKKYYIVGKNAFVKKANF